MSDEAARTVEFFNLKQPELKIFISRAPVIAGPGGNALLADDKFAQFQSGHFSTSDPEIIAALNSASYRAKGVRCRENMADMAEYGTAEDAKTYMELEIERRVQAALEEKTVLATHLIADGALTPEMVAESVPTPDEEPEYARPRGKK